MPLGLENDILIKSIRATQNTNKLQNQVLANEELFTDAFFHPDTFNFSPFSQPSFAEKICQNLTVDKRSHLFHFCLWLDQRLRYLPEYTMLLCTNPQHACLSPLASLPPLQPLSQQSSLPHHYLYSLQLTVRTLLSAYCLIATL